MKVIAWAAAPAGIVAVMVISKARIEAPPIWSEVLVSPETMPASPLRTEAVAASVRLTKENDEPKPPMAKAAMVSSR
ncbi:hypothetical protein D9M70_615090 [compost metagenome]